MGIGKSLEPAMRGRRLLGKCEHSLRRCVVDNIELVIELHDHPLVRRTWINISDIFRSGLAETGERRPLPIVTPLPYVPLAIGIKAFQRVGTESDRRIKVEFGWVLLLLENMFGHNPCRVPAHGEEGVES